MRRFVLVAVLAAAGACSVVDAPTAMRRCEAKVMRASLYGGEGAGGHSNAWLVLSNAGDRPCVVEGPARLGLYDKHERLVTASEGVSPYIRAGRPGGPFRIDARTKPEDFDRKRAGVVWVSVAQGPCPGGVFPAEGTLVVVLADVGRIRVDGFEDTLPFDSRCETASARAGGTPTLLVSRLAGSKPVALATPTPSPSK